MLVMRIAVPELRALFDMFHEGMSGGVVGLVCSRLHRGIRPARTWVLGRTRGLGERSTV